MTDVEIFDARSGAFSSIDDQLKRDGNARIVCVTDQIALAAVTGDCGEVRTNKGDVTTVEIGLTRGDVSKLRLYKAEPNRYSAGTTVPTDIVATPSELVFTLNDTVDDMIEGQLREIKGDRVVGEVQVGDFVLYRTTSPLVRGCLEVIRRGIPAHLKGSDGFATP